MSSDPGHSTFPSSDHPMSDTSSVDSSHFESSSNPAHLHSLPEKSSSDRSEDSKLPETHFSTSTSDVTTLQPHLSSSPHHSAESTVIDPQDSKPDPSITVISSFKPLSNHSNIFADFSKDNFLNLNEETFEVHEFDWTSRSLQVSEFEIMFTGGKSKRSAFIFDLRSKETKVLAEFAVGRDLHAMAWIINYPAVIGGGDEMQKPLSSVEVFKDDRWIGGPSLKYARYGHTATSYLDETWVVGGAESRDAAVVHIEVLNAAGWTPIQLTLPHPAVGIGLVAVNDNLYLLGGFTLNRENTDQVLVINLQTHQFIQSDKKLQQTCCFSQNIWKISSDRLESYSLGGRKVVYGLEL